MFLSYAREDRESARRLTEAIGGRGWSVWWDRRIPAGKAWDNTIEREIEAASCVVVLWSESALSSEWVRNEAGEGARRHVLVPVRLEDVRVPLGFRHLQSVDLFRWTSAELGHCLESIEAMIGAPAAVQPKPKQKRWRWRWILASVVAALLIALAIGLALPKTPARGYEDVLVWSDKVDVSATIVDLETPDGIITIELDPNAALHHVANFQKIVRAGGFNDAPIYFASRAGIWAGFRCSAALQQEPNDLAFDRGAVIGVQDFPLNTDCDTRFVITRERVDWDRTTHTAFGRVIAGIEVVDTIAARPVNPLGQPTRPITITRAAIRKR
ncbi:MAG TPA: TIR domain-containing protein [Thermoanaerobaculia bacterium]|nr:TIR domain-containing protein [Thermoanaerobaculia bacterium]